MLRGSLARIALLMLLSATACGLLAIDSPSLGAYASPAAGRMDRNTAGEARGMACDVAKCKAGGSTCASNRCGYPQGALRLRGGDRTREPRGPTGDVGAPGYEDPWLQENVNRGEEKGEKALNRPPEMEVRPQFLARGIRRLSAPATAHGGSRRRTSSGNAGAGDARRPDGGCCGNECGAPYPRAQGRPSLGRCLPAPFCGDCCVSPWAAPARQYSEPSSDVRACRLAEAHALEEREDGSGGGQGRTAVGDVGAASKRGHSQVRHPPPCAPPSAPSCTVRLMRMQLWCSRWARIRGRQHQLCGVVYRRGLRVRKDRRQS